MAQNRRYVPNKRQAARSAPDIRSLRRPPEVTVRPPPVVYGKPFIVVEDEARNTFIFKAGSWVPYTASIAECRQTCQVKELPQRVNRMIRDEVRCPEGSRE